MRQRYRADAMAFWLHLVPKLHRRDSFQPVFHAPDVNSTDDVTTMDVAMETASATEPGFPWLAENESTRTSLGPDQAKTSDDGLVMVPVSVSATGGGRLLLATLVVGGTLLLINCVVFVATLCHRSYRINELATAKPAQPTAYVSCFGRH